MKSFVAIMNVTPEGRVAKYADFETEQEAIDHVDQFSDEWPNAFPHAAIQGSLQYWKADPVAKSLTFEPDSTELDQKVKRAIKEYGNGLINDFMAEAQFDIGASIHLLFIRTERQWSAGEQPFVDEQKANFKYIRDIYIDARSAIQNIPNMTETEKLNFNPATDVTWTPKP